MTAAISLLVTAAYVMLAVYEDSTARLLGPVYALLILALWAVGFFVDRKRDGRA